MGNWYSGDHIAGDHIHMDIALCNMKEPQKKSRIGTVSNRVLYEWCGDLTHFTGNKPLALCFCSDSKHLAHKKVSELPNPSMNQHRKQTNHASNKKMSQKSMPALQPLVALIGFA